MTEMTNEEYEAAFAESKEAMKAMADMMRPMLGISADEELTDDVVDLRLKAADFITGEMPGDYVVEWEKNLTDYQVVHIVSMIAHVRPILPIHGSRLMAMCLMLAKRLALKDPQCIAEHEEHLARAADEDERERRAYA